MTANQTVRDVLRVLEVLAPPHLVLEGDPQPSREPRALLVGDPDAPIKNGVVVALDVTQKVVEAAKAAGAGLIIAHHPLIYYPAKTLRADEAHPGAVILAAVQAGIAVAAAHTNWDVAPGGINDTLARLLHLENVRPLRVTHGEGGIGRVGTLATPLSASAFLQEVCVALHFPHVRMVGPLEKSVRTVAVCGGAGAFLMDDALAHGADAFVTSEVRHHEFVDADTRGLALLDAGHAQTETPGTRELARLLGEKLGRLAVTFV